MSNTFFEDNTFLTVYDVADKLNVSYRTVLKYIKSGKLEAYKVGKSYKVSLDQLEKFFKGESV